MNVKKALLIALGCVGLVLGAVGAVVPLLPAFPFLMLAAFCFAKSSERLHAWFTGTSLYKKNLESYVTGKGMDWATKIRVMVTVTILMAIGFAMMHAVRMGQVVLRVGLSHPVLLLRREDPSCRMRPAKTGRAPRPWLDRTRFCR